MHQFFTYSAEHPMSEETVRQVMAIMEEAFPAVERRIAPAQRALLSHPLYCVYTVEENGRTVAFMAAWKLRGFTFFEHFAVRADRRGGGIGGRMLDELLKTNPRAVLEVELPQDELTCRRVGFYRRHGMRLNERAYCQMPLREGDAPVPMYLMSSPDELTEDEFICVRREIYRHVYGIEEVPARIN